MLTLEIPWASCCLGIPAWCATYTLCTHLYKVSTTFTWHNILSTQFKLNICGLVKSNFTSPWNEWTCKRQVYKSNARCPQHHLTQYFEHTVQTEHMYQRLLILRTFQLGIYCIYRFNESLGFVIIKKGVLLSFKYCNS